MVIAMSKQEALELIMSLQLLITTTDKPHIARKASSLKAILEKEYLTINPKWEKATYGFVPPDYTPINVGPPPKIS